MSQWSYIYGVIVIDTGLSTTALKDINKFLKTAPKITGSEKDADIFVNQPSGYNFATDDDNGGTLHVHTVVILTIHGCLRDKNKKQTKKEFELFSSKLRENFFIEFSRVYIS